MHVFRYFLYVMVKKDRIGHEGIVKSIAEQTIDVRIVSRSACAACHAKSMCGIAETVQKTVTAQRPDFPVLPGDKVMVYATVRNALYSVMMAYIFPSVILVGTIAGLVAAGYEEITAAAGALTTLSVYFAGLYFSREKIGKKIKFTVEKMSVSDKA